MKGTHASFFNKEKRSFTTCFQNVIFFEKEADKSVEEIDFLHYEISVVSLLVSLPLSLCNLQQDMNILFSERNKN